MFLDFRDEKKSKNIVNRANEKKFIATKKIVALLGNYQIDKLEKQKLTPSSIRKQLLREKF